MLSALSSVAGTGGRFATTVMIAHALSPEAYGQFVFLQWVIDLLNMLCGFGLPGLMTRFLPELSLGRSASVRGAPRAIAMASLASTFLSNAAFLAYVSLDPRFAGLNPLILALWCLSTTVIGFLYAALQGIFRYGSVMVANLIFAVAGPALTYALVHGHSATEAALALTLAMGAAIAGALLTSSWSSSPQAPAVRRYPPSSRTLATYAFNLWITGLIGGLVWSRGEFGVLRMQVDNSQIAIYSAALTLCGLINQGVGLLTGALTPHLVRRWNSGRTEEVSEVLRVITQATIICAAGAAIVIICFGRTLLPLAFGSKYLAAYPIACLLAAAGIAICASPAYAILQIETNAGFGFVLNIVNLLTLIVLGVILTPMMGVLGAAIGRVASQMTFPFAAFWRLRRVHGMADLYWRLLCGWASTTLVVSLTALAFWRYSPNLVASLVIAPVVFGATVCLARMSVRSSLFAILKLQ